MPGDGPAVVRLRLDGELTIYRAAELKEALMQPLAHAGVLEVDLSDVSEIDTAGLQLLILARRAAGERQGELRLSGHSAAVQEVFELLRLCGHFGAAPPAITPAPAQPAP